MLASSIDQGVWTALRSSSLAYTIRNSDILPSYHSRQFVRRAKQQARTWCWAGAALLPPPGTSRTGDLVTLGVRGVASASMEADWLLPSRNDARSCCCAVPSQRRSSDEQHHGPDEAGMARCDMARNKRPFLRLEIAFKLGRRNWHWLSYSGRRVAPNGPSAVRGYSAKLLPCFVAAEQFQAPRLASLLHSEEALCTLFAFPPPWVLRFRRRQVSDTSATARHRQPEDLIGEDVLLGLPATLVAGKSFCNLLCKERLHSSWP